MSGQGLDPELAHWAKLIEELRWAAFLVDRESRLVWVSPDLQRFIGSPPEHELGHGLHVLEAFSQEPWQRIATVESRMQLLMDLAPVVMGVTAERELDVDFGSVSEWMRTLVQEVEPRSFARPIATYFDYVEPGGDTELPVMRVNVLAAPIRSEDGDLIGAVAIGYMAIR